MDNDQPSTCDVLNPDCPSRRTLALLADKWVLLVIVALSKNDRLRNGELKRMLGDISQKMLVRTLRQLEYNGIVRRIVFPEIPPHVEYELTDLGRSLLTPIYALRDWSEQNAWALETARRAAPSPAADEMLN